MTRRPRWDTTPRMTDVKRKRAQAQKTAGKLDAFGFWPASASRIRGLGGRAIDPDPAYAFHSKYIEVGGGIVTATLRFDRLNAEAGELTIRVNGAPPGVGARAETLRTWTSPLLHIAEAGGIVEVSFQASAGSRYAVLGSIYGETDASAAGLDIEMAITASEDSEEQRAAARKSMFGRRMFRRANRMIDQTRATLVDPVSQTCTAAQFDEPAFVRWAQALHAVPRLHRAMWEQVYILQVLDRYSMLRPGARGLGIGVDDSPLPAIMAARGCTIVATDPPPTTPPASAPVEALRLPEFCADDVFDRLVSHRFVDPAALESDLAGFDFCWSAGALTRIGSVAAGMEFVRKVISALTFGGLAVHTADFNLSSNLDSITEGDDLLYRRQDLERIAVDLVSRGHFVAQFKYDVGTALIDEEIDEPPYRDEPHLKFRRGDHVATSFGMITRRGDR